MLILASVTFGGVAGMEVLRPADETTLKTIWFVAFSVGALMELGIGAWCLFCWRYDLLKERHQFEDRKKQFYDDVLARIRSYNSADSVHD
jgi:hypothetical protein